MVRPTYVTPLPHPGDIETVRVLKALNKASRALADLKGQTRTIQNQDILIGAVALQDAKASCEIENIVTTQDALLQADLFPGDPNAPAAKKVALCRDALRLGYARLCETSGLIPNTALADMLGLLKDRDDGLRVSPGTALKNEQPDEPEIADHLSALERLINDDGFCALDPLIKMALIHHQFDSIHLFAAGNGRIARILNVLYLTRAGLLDIPVLSLSQFILCNRADYHRHLQAVRDSGAWEDWVVYMLEAVAESSGTTAEIVIGIRDQMAAMKHRMRLRLPKIYSRDLLNNIFRHPYTGIEYVQRDLGVTRQTAAKYLDTLAKHGFVEKCRSGKRNYFINVAAVKLLQDVSGRSCGLADVGEHFHKTPGGLL